MKRYQYIWKAALEYLNDVSRKEWVEQELADAGKQKQIKRINDIYFSLLQSISSPAMMPRVIGRIDYFRDITNDLDPNFILTFDENRLKAYLSGKHPVLIRRGKTVDDSVFWMRFTRGMIEGARWLADMVERVGSAQALVEYFRGRCSSPEECLALAYEIYPKITGLGPATTLDFLMDLGLTQIGKPDTHTKDILAAAGLISDVSTKYDDDAFKQLWLIAEHNKTCTRCVDRIFWIIGSGKFQVVDADIGRDTKKEFLGRLREISMK